jgi:quercetin dioxygenase-like cupin family protein
MVGARVEEAPRAHIIDAARAQELSEADKKHFIGHVTMQRFAEGVVPAGLDVAVVFFDSEARTRPHVHPTAQVLHFILGRGFVAFPGEQDQKIGEGGVFIVPAGALHMHGATSRGRMGHLAVKAAGETDWEPDLPEEWSIWHN